MLALDVGYRRAHHDDLDWDPQLEVTEIEAGRRARDGTACGSSRAASDHRPVEPTLAYRIEHDGHAVVLAGDTVPCAGLDELCAGADVYVQTVLRDDLVNMVPMQRFRDTVDYHSTLEQAAQTAARAGVKTLVLTHQIPTPAPGLRRRVDRDRAQGLRRRHRVRRGPHDDRRPVRRRPTRTCARVDRCEGCGFEYELAARDERGRGSIVSQAGLFCGVLRDGTIDVRTRPAPRRVVAARVRVPRARRAPRAARAGARSAAHRLPGARRRWAATNGPSTTATPSRTRAASPTQLERGRVPVRQRARPARSRRLGAHDRVQLPDADGALAALGRGAHRARAAAPPARHPPPARVATPASPSGRALGCARWRRRRRSPRARDAHVGSRISTAER